MTDPRTLDVIGDEVFAAPRPDQIRLVHVLYLLHAIGLVVGAWSQAVTVVGAFVFGWSSVIAIIINYVKRDDLRGTYLQTHLVWQADTFWRCLIAMLVISALYLLLVGFLINWLLFAVVGVWAVYRIAKGWLALRDGKPMRS
ncbi:MAG: hypothetical protein REI09_04675 [Candidatus Dactylopiibacterium sp.]|nr:hypothetical protein [Candidatus Dactylopiibacterium sp.]